MRKMKNNIIIAMTYVLLLGYMLMAVVHQYVGMAICGIIVAMVIYANLTDEKEENEK